MGLEDKYFMGTQPRFTMKCHNKCGFQAEEIIPTIKDYEKNIYRGWQYWCKKCLDSLLDGVKEKE